MITDILRINDILRGRGCSGGGVDLYDHGIYLGNCTSLDILGDGHSANATSIPGEMELWCPPPSYPYSFNEDSTTAANITYDYDSGRLPSQPTVEGTPFAIGGWTPGSTVVVATNDGSLVVSSNGPVLFDDSATTIAVNIYDETGAILATHTTSAITGNINVTSSNITIQVSSWTAIGAKASGLIDVGINILGILPAGGRFRWEIVHYNGVAGNFYAYHGAGLNPGVQSNYWLMYDPNTNTPSITTVGIAENVLVEKYLSGVRYYTLNSTFTVDLTDVDYANDISFDPAICTIQAPLYAMADYNVQHDEAGPAPDGVWTGRDNMWNNTGADYQKQNMTIDTPNVTVIERTAGATIRATVNDWLPLSWTTSSGDSILVETHSTSSTNTHEYFYEESYRCPASGNFDAANAASWTSSNHNASDEAVFIDGGCERRDDDFTMCKPNAVSQPDYSGSHFDTTVYVIRQFQHDGSASSGFTLTINGTYSSLEYKLAKAWDGSSSGGTGWIDGQQAYNAAQWNNGNPLSGGGNTGGDHYTFGTNNIINCNDQLYVRIGLSGTDRINTELSVDFD